MAADVTLAQPSMNVLETQQRASSMVAVFA